MPTKLSVVTVATDEELRRPSYRNRLKLAVRNIGIGQRDWATEIQNMFLRADMRGIKFRRACGKPFQIPLVDDVWAGNERYVRQFLASKPCQCPEKDRLIDLFFRVTAPDVARHFGR